MRTRTTFRAATDFVLVNSEPVKFVRLGGRASATDNALSVLSKTR